jgi:hypothetical protein
VSGGKELVDVCRPVADDRRPTTVFDSDDFSSIGTMSIF